MFNIPNEEPDVKAIPFNTKDEGVDYPLLARQAVWEVVKDVDPVIKFDDIYVVSFTYILSDWKAMVSSSRPDGKYYEVTYDYETDVTYVDTYVKIKQDELSCCSDQHS